MEANGWQLLAHSLFLDQLERLTSRVEDLAVERSAEHPLGKLLATIRRYVLDIIPRDPNAPEFRLGNTLGAGNRHWFRAKFHQRYRLFFRFSTKHKIIIYAWVNDESSLRKSGAKTDPYALFKSMLECGNPPASFDDLLKLCRPVNKPRI